MDERDVILRGRDRRARKKLFKAISEGDFDVFDDDDDFGFLPASTFVSSFAFSCTNGLPPQRKARRPNGLGYLLNSKRSGTRTAKRRLSARSSVSSNASSLPLTPSLPTKVERKVAKPLLRPNASWTPRSYPSCPTASSTYRRSSRCCTSL